MGEQILFHCLTVQNLVWFSRDVAGLSRTGHYIADVYDAVTGRWSTCDDTSVHGISEDYVRTARASTGYIFFYEAKYICTSSLSAYLLII